MPVPKMIAVGDKLLGKLVGAAWIEQNADARDLYRVTDQGRTAFSTPVPLR